MNIKSTLFSTLLLSGIAFGFTGAEAGDRISVHSCSPGDSGYHRDSRHSWSHPGYWYPHHEYGYRYHHDQGRHYGHYRQADRREHPASQDNHRQPYRDDRGQARNGEHRHG